jgi:hypothetical protein
MGEMDDTSGRTARWIGLGIVFYRFSKHQKVRTQLQNSKHLIKKLIFIHKNLNFYTKLEQHKAK